MKGYKAFNNDMTCRGFQYEVGKTYEMAEKPIPCKQGFHFCKSIADCYRFYGMSDGTRICEVEAVGEIAIDDNIKYCTNKIRIVSEITEDWARRGNANSSNNGYCNTGYRNTGDCNTGDCNTGDWNTTNFSSGCFCTENKHIQMFDEESKWTYEDWLSSDARIILKKIPDTTTIFVLSEDMSEKEKEEHPYYKTTGGYLKECKATSEEKQKWWDSIPEEDKEKIKKLPNFDEEKFCKCTGIVHI